MALAAAFLEVDPARHDLKGFACGRPSMNDFLARQALAFYRHVGGFTPFPGNPLRLFVPMHALEAIG